MAVYDIISEPLKANYPKMPRSEMEDRVREMAAKVGLNPVTSVQSYPILKL